DDAEVDAGEAGRADAGVAAAVDAAEAPAADVDTEIVTVAAITMRRAALAHGVLGRHAQVGFELVVEPDRLALEAVGTQAHARQRTVAGEVAAHRAIAVAGLALVVGGALHPEAELVRGQIRNHGQVAAMADLVRLRATGQEGHQQSEATNPQSHF